MVLFATPGMLHGGKLIKAIKKVFRYISCFKQNKFIN